MGGSAEQKGQFDLGQGGDQLRPPTLGALLGRRQIGPLHSAGIAERHGRDADGGVIIEGGPVHP